MALAIPVGTVLTNMTTGDNYRLEATIGQGGFGTIFAASPADGRPLHDGVPFCVKVGLDADVWHGEAFYAGLLKGSTSVVRQLDAFPTFIPVRGGQRLGFAIFMEYIPGGSVADHFGLGAEPWGEEQVLRKTKVLLRTLDLLHERGVSHRDITPMNVFVGNRKALKLGDFGIAKTGLIRSGVRADVANWAFAPNDLQAFWRPADDVFQVGLLMATLASGELQDNTMGKVAVNRFTTKGPLRDAIKAAISVKSQRPQSAAELVRLL